MTYKVSCKIDKNKGDGIVDHIVYIKATDEKDAEYKAKVYWIMRGADFFGANSIIKM